MTVHDLPALNASLNGLCTVWLLAGYACIKTDRKKAHAAFMILALVTSAAFLTGYITYHAAKHGEMTEFPKEYSVARLVYLCILIPHIILAVVNVPLVVMTVIPAARQRFDRHRKLAKWTFPIWLYVSVTGVLVYMMLYQWFPGGTEMTEPANGGAEAAITTEPSGKHGVVTFDSTVFEYHARPEEEILHTSFVMTNSGDGPLKITGMDTSCTCLDVRTDKKVLAPGEQARIEADFSLEKLAGYGGEVYFCENKLTGIQGIPLERFG